MMEVTFRIDPILKNPMVVTDYVSNTAGFSILGEMVPLRVPVTKANLKVLFVVHVLMANPLILLTMASSYWSLLDVALLVVL